MANSKTKAKMKYNAENYERLTIRVYTGEKEQIAEAARAVGASVNAYVTDAVRAKMELQAQEK